MELLTRNSKIKKSTIRTFNFGIPAYQSSSGLKTCPNAGACAKGCYALAGAYRFSNVARAFEARLVATQLKSFSNKMIAAIKKVRAEQIRIHDSGDFYNEEYVNKWISVMQAMPQVKFYAYTKMVSLFKRLDAEGKIPENFTVVYSYGGTEDKLIEPMSDRHSLVFDSIEQLKACGYADVTESDDAAADATVIKVGLVYHGTKNLNNTDWDKVLLKKELTK